MGARHKIPAQFSAEKKEKMITILSRKFYERSDVVQVARELLGMWLFTELDGKLTGGIIIETEAYAGPRDKASHAHNNRRTERTEVLFGRGGHAYVHMCYGIHYLLNAVANKEGIPNGVLIRAISPQCGIETMLKRRGKKKLDATLTSGPGALCQALGITKELYGHDLTSPPLWIEDRGVADKQHISAGPRVGVEYAKEDALLPWRFKLEI